MFLISFLLTSSRAAKSCMNVNKDTIANTHVLFYSIFILQMPLKTLQLKYSNMIFLTYT